MEGEAGVLAAHASSGLGLDRGFAVEEAFVLGVSKVRIWSQLRKAEGKEGWADPGERMHRLSGGKEPSFQVQRKPAEWAEPWPGWGLERDGRVSANQGLVGHRELSPHQRTKDRSGKASLILPGLHNNIGKMLYTRCVMSSVLRGGLCTPRDEGLVANPKRKHDASFQFQSHCVSCSISEDVRTWACSHDHMWKSPSQESFLSP